MKGSFYRYQAPKLLELKTKTLEELTPIHQFRKPKSNIAARTLIFNGDHFLIMMMVSTLISLGLNLELELLGPYQSLSDRSSTLAMILVSSFPISFLITLTYYSLSHFFNGAATPINKINRTRIVPIHFITDGSITSFQLSPEQSLKRALGHSLNSLLCYLPNLVMLIDDHKRSFPDLFSQTITIEDEEFIKLVQTKGSPEYQVMIDIETLETIDQIETEDDYLIAA